MPNAVKISVQKIKTTHEFKTIPGDKSVSHRALMCAAIAEGRSEITGFLASEDCLNTLKILQQLGVTITKKSDEHIIVEGVGQCGLQGTLEVLDVGNSGTGIRLLTGLLAAQPFTSTISGDHSIQKRPMRRVIDPLSEMGAKITGETLNNDTVPPLIISGGQPLKGIHYKMPVASAQVKSAILFAALYAQGPTIVSEPKLCRDHSERMFAQFGADIQKNGLETVLQGQQRLKSPGKVLVPKDISSAAFFMVLGAILPTANFQLNEIGMNPTRAAVAEALNLMGANIQQDLHGAPDTEQYAQLTCKSARLKNIHIPEPLIPILIDEIPILAVASMFAEGEFKVSAAKELRVKESDRIESTGALIKAMGGEFKSMDDGFICRKPDKIKPFTINSLGDHRIAMSGIIAALGAGVEAVIEGVDCINTSFPNFFEILDELGTEYSFV